MKNRMKYAVMDSVTMLKRCLLLSMRSPDALFTGIAQPLLMMLLFVYVLGGAMNVGEMNYINYIVPGVVLQCIGQCTATTAISVNNDMKKGIMDRFRSMAITKASILTGHAVSAAIRNIISTSLVIGLALLMGFRPTAGAAQWLAVAGILLLFMLAFTWISIIFGLIANSAESASSFTILTIVLPYLSSGFVPTESMPAALRIFAQNQPMTPIIEAIRSLMMGTAPGGNLMEAVLWCVGMLVVFSIIAIRIFQRKLAE